MKYGLQAKIGRMDGVIVAYHNTAEIFGFQYIPLEDMERCIYGESLSLHVRHLKNHLSLQRCPRWHGGSRCGLRS